MPLDSKWTLSRGGMLTLLSAFLYPEVGARGRAQPALLSGMDPLRAQQLAAELEVEMMADMYNR